MAWTVDSCVLLDIALGDPVFARPSAQLLDRLCGDGLIICPVTVVEIAPCFGGSVANVRRFMQCIGGDADWDWMPTDTQTAAEAWARHVSFMRTGQSPRRPIADILIGAFAVRTGGLVTRNAKHFSTIFPQLRIIGPKTAV